MPIELSCEIVRDLLPNYVDGLTSDASNEAVERHLKQCSDCRDLYETMKKEYQQPAMRQKDTELENQQEKTLFQKINYRLNKKVRCVAIAGIAGVILAGILFHCLFNLPLKEIPVEDVMVSAHVYDMEYLAVHQGIGIHADDNDGDQTVTISKGEDSIGNVKTVAIPDNPNLTFNITDAVLEDCSYVTAIEYQSSYILRKIDAEYKTVNNEHVVYVSGFHTTLLNNKSKNWNNSSTTMDFSKVDKIIYVDDNNTEKILWEN